MKNLIIIALGILLAAAIVFAVTNGPSDSLEDVRAQRDSAKADRDSVAAVAESLAQLAVKSQKITDSIKAVKQQVDTMVRIKIKYTTQKIARAETLAPGDTIWKPLLFEVMDQRDSLLTNSYRADTIIARQDTTIRDQQASIITYQQYQDKAERRISQLETWQEDQLKSFKLFGLVPLPKLQVTAGLNTRLEPDAVLGLGYTVKFGRKRVPRPPPDSLP
ncbi:MAG: hypothetical protein MN733_23010 [Nitrososphaera sp.]|nr:hypothetical protein [Nitrososphaera sp.]